MRFVGAHQLLSVSAHIYDQPDLDRGPATLKVARNSGRVISARSCFCAELSGATSLTPLSVCNYSFFQSSTPCKIKRAVWLAEWFCFDESYVLTSHSDFFRKCHLGVLIDSCLQVASQIYFPKIPQNRASLFRKLCVSKSLGDRSNYSQNSQ